MKKKRLRLKWKIAFAASGVITAAVILNHLMPEGSFHPFDGIEITSSSEYETPLADEKLPQSEPVTLSDWKKVNPSVRYLLTFEDDCLRQIPVLQTADSDYALRHNLHGAYDTMGSVFTDPQSSAPDNLVIYGHSSRTKNRAFTFLKHYADSDYYTSHPFFTLQDDTGIARCRVVSLASYDLNQEDMFDLWAQDWFDDAEDVQQMFENTVPYLIQHTEGISYHGEQIITLVTCDMSADNTRYVLQALRMDS